MALTYYNNYLKNLARSPNDAWREEQQAMISLLYEDTTLLKKDIYEEALPFDFTFNPIQCWVGTVSEASINAEKDFTDYRALYFEDCNHQVMRGRFYKWDNNYWMVYEASTELESISKTKIRRCNNIAKWVDTETGAINEMPCVLDYTISSTSPHSDKDIDTANSSTTLILQGNELTHKLTKNQRFIFNQQPFKFVAWNNYMQNDYITKDTPMLFMDIDLDIVQDDDDLVNNIANRYSYNYTINIIQDNSSQVNGFVGQLNAEVKLNNQVVSRNIVWESNEFATINQDGTYRLNGAIGSVVVLKAYIEGNSSVVDEVSIEIVEAPTNVLELIIDPLYNKINVNKENKFTVTLYKDGVAQSNVITYTASGVDSSYYYLKQNGNEFTLIANKPSSVPLTLTFTSNTIIKSIDIQLKSAF